MLFPVYRSLSYHCAESNQTNQRIGGKKRQTHNERVLHGLQAVIFLASIDDKDEDRGSGGRSCQLVLDGCALRVEFGGYRVLRDVLVVRGKRIP
jgi:hypothetical protein